MICFRSVKQVGKATLGLGRMVAPRIQEKGTKLIASYTGKSEKESSEQVGSSYTIFVPYTYKFAVIKSFRALSDRGLKPPRHYPWYKFIMGFSVWFFSAVTLLGRCWNGGDGGCSSGRVSHLLVSRIGRAESLHFTQPEHRQSRVTQVRHIVVKV